MLTTAISVGHLDMIVRRVLLPGRPFAKAQARTVCSNVSTRQLCNRPAVSLWLHCVTLEDRVSVQFSILVLLELHSGTSRRRPP